MGGADADTEAVAELIEAAADLADPAIIRAVTAAVVGLEVPDDEWAALQPALVALAGTGLVRALATAGVVGRLDEIASLPGHPLSPAAAIAMNKLDAAQDVSRRIDRAVAVVRADPTGTSPESQSALAELACLPIEEAGVSAKLLAKAAKSPDPDVRFWALVARARLGQLDAVDDIVQMLERDETPSFLWGDPWTAYDRMAGARPGPDALQEKLVELWCRGEQHRDSYLFLGAMTGLSNAEGRPISDDEPVSPEPVQPPPSEAERMAALEVLRAVQLDHDVLAPESVRALPADEAARLVEYCIVTPPRDATDAIGLGNFLVRISDQLDLSVLPTTPIIEDYIEGGAYQIDERQVGYVISRNGIRRMAVAFSQVMRNEYYSAQREVTVGLSEGRDRRLGSLIESGFQAVRTNSAPMLSTGPMAGPGGGWLRGEPFGVDLGDLPPPTVDHRPGVWLDPPLRPVDEDSYRGDDADYGVDASGDGDGDGDGGGGGSDGSKSEGDDAMRVFAAQILPSPTEPVQVGTEYGLSISVEVGPVENQLGTAPVPESLIFPDGSAAEVELAVQLDSSDCKIIDKIPRLVVPRAGPSAAAAEFGVEPLHDGPCRLIATMHAAGNFVQQLELTLDVGTATQPHITGSVGRPIDAVSVLRPRGIGIVLRRMEGSYLCVVADAKTASAVLPITDDLLAISVERVRQALLTVVQSTDAEGLAPFQRQLDIPHDAADAALRTLAYAGATLFADLFEPPQQSPGALALGRYLRRAACNPDSLLTIQIASDGIIIPWGLMYVGDTSDGATLSWDGFLGLRHVVEQLPVQDTMDDGDDTDILSTPNLRVNVNLNDQIDLKWGTDFVSKQAAYWERSKATRAGLSVTVDSTLQQLISALQDGGSDQIIYLYCHATAAGMAGAGDPLDSTLELSDQAVTLAELRRLSPMSSKLAGHPLVFINACESAELSPRFYEGFAPYLIAKGSRGVVGTECRMPALFAADWAHAFFERLLAGMPLGQTMHELCQFYLRDHNNPLGMVYAMHCSADTQITPPIAVTAGG